MSTKSAGWIIGLLLTLVLVALLGPGASAWARPRQLAQTVPTPTPTRSEAPQPPTATRSKPSSPAQPPTDTPTPLPTETLGTPTSPPAVAIPRSDMNVRQGPGTEYPVIGTARAGQAYPITGRNAMGDWWRIEYLRQPGWLYAPLTETQGDVAGIPVITEIPSAPGISPTATPVPEIPELDLALSADPPWAVPGRMLTFRLTVHNGGNSDAEEVTARDELPELITLREASSSQGEVVLEGQVVLARLGTLLPGTTAIITMTGTVAPDAPLGGIIDHLIEVTSAEGFWQSVGVSVPLPPAELPPTGARLPDSD